METTFLTIVIPFDGGSVGGNGSVATQLARFGNLHRGDLPPDGNALRSRLDLGERIHFMSLNVLEKERDGKSRLLVEVTADGSTHDAIAELAEVLDTRLRGVLDAVGAPQGTGPVAAFLSEHSLAIGPGWRSPLGLPFNGTPGMTVRRIKREARLASMIQQLVGVGSSPFIALQEVRARVWARGEKWAFSPEPIAWLAAERLSEPASRRIGFATFFLPPAAVGLAAAVAAGLAVRWLSNGWWGLLASIVVATVLLAAAVAAATMFYRNEARDRSVDKTPSEELIKAVMAHENRCSVQNHLFAVSTMKPGTLRELALRLALTLVRQVAGWTHQPGFLSGIGMIHSARWFRVPGTDKLVFFSNYGGSWESYLEDFIEKANRGVTAIWSNTKEFPKTRWLFMEGGTLGATDGDRFKRWARRQQRPTLLWYCAYPELTTTRIRLNAVIRQGLANARTEAEAADWLSCFGSAPRPPASLEISEIPTLLFGALSPLHCGQALLVRFNRPNANRWLRRMTSQLTYGDESPANPKRSAVLTAFTASGLCALGMTDTELATFSPPFRDGMAQPWRSRVLGDLGENAPENWLWGGLETPVDAVVLLYARTACDLKELVDEHCADLADDGHRIVAEVVFKDLMRQQRTISQPIQEPIKERPDHLRPGHVERYLDRSNADLAVEPFGFADGISQPIIRGTKRWTKVQDQNHLVAPGELILGYPDNGNHIPPTPTVSAERDPKHILPALANDVSYERPDFTSPRPSSARDFGRNGTFLVIRQLEQDVHQFKRFVEDAAGRLPADLLPGRTDEQKQEWIAAKLVGRWRDGTSLVRHPNEAGTAAGRTARPDNDFLFGPEDADGRRCPLGAHIRRVNPRDSLSPHAPEPLKITNRHRILRVGRSYYAQSRRHPKVTLPKPGLFFMCLNADIERQFEFVQQTWTMGASFHGLNGEVDCFAPRGATLRITIPTEMGPLCLSRLEDFVKVIGGGYFFLPGRRSIRFLAEGAPAAAPAARHEARACRVG